MILVGLVAVLSGCGQKAPETRIDTIADMKGRRLGVLSGSAYRECTERLQEGIVYESFNDIASAMVALKTGKIEGVPVDEPIARHWVAQNSGVVRIAQVYTSDHYAFAFKKGSELRNKFTEVIRRLRADGTFERYARKWCDATQMDISFEPLSEGPGHTGAGGTLKVALSPEFEPVSYVVRGKIIGMEPEIVRRIAWELDMKVEFEPLSFGAIIEAVKSGKADLAGGAIIVTDARKQAVDFAAPHYSGGIALLVRDSGEGKCNGFFRGLATSFRRTFVEEARWRDILVGLGRTLAITLLATLLGTVLAFPVWLLRTAKGRFARACGDAYVSVMQGTPILVVLMILYYIVFASCDIEGEIVAVIGFALNFAAYAGEMLRTGIAAVPPGQREAALAIGFAPLEAFWRVVFPQAVRHILPVYRGEVIGLLKATSVVGYIAVVDLTKVSDLIRARTYEAFFPLIATAVIYFVLAHLIARSLARVEYFLKPVVRRNKEFSA